MLSVQPTLQELQVVETHSSVFAIHLFGFSRSVAVGQTSMQAPQKSQARLVDGAAGAEGDAGRFAATGECDCACVADLVAGPDALRADNAHLGVELKEGVGPVGLRLLALVVGALFAQPGLVVRHLQHLVRRLELAAVVLGAGEAAVRYRVVAQADVARLAVDAPVAG